MMAEQAVRAKKILIVEDDMEIHSMYKIYFAGQEDKYMIDIEPLAKEALNRVQTEKFDLIILDIIMEPMTGDEFFVYLRENPQTKEIPVLVVSVLKPDILSELKKINHVSFFQKPITKAQLFEKIEQMLKK